MSQSEGERFTSEIEDPPTLAPSDVDNNFPTPDQRDLSGLVALTEQMPGLQPAINQLESNLSESQAEEVQRYAVAFVPPVYEDFMRRTILDTAVDADASPSDSELSARIADRIGGANSVETAKDQIDRVVRDRLGINTDVAPLIGQVNRSLKDLPIDASIPFPRTRIGPGDVVNEPGTDHLIDLDGTAQVNIAPVDKNGNPVPDQGGAPGFVVGPRAGTTEPTTVEMVYRSESGQAGTIAHVLFRFLVFFFEATGCAMAAAAFYERVWVPVLLHNTRVEGTFRFPVAFEPDRDQLLAIRFQPIGKNLRSAAIRVIN